MIRGLNFESKRQIFCRNKITMLAYEENMSQLPMLSLHQIVLEIEKLEWVFCLFLSVR